MAAPLDGGVSSRLRETRRIVLDEAARNRRQRKALDALEADNFQADPHADLKISKHAPKFEENFGSSDSLSATVGPSSAKKARKTKSSVAVLARGRVRKNFAALLEEEHLRNGGQQTPYELAQVPPSKLPPRRFCAVCGFTGPHTCILCGARFCSVICFNTHQDTRCLKWTG